MKSIQMDGPLTISNISNCAHIISNAFDAKIDQLTVGLANVEDCDTAGIQLMISMKKSANHQNMKLIFKEVPEVITHACKRMGIEDICQFLETEL